MPFPPAHLFALDHYTDRLLPRPPLLPRLPPWLAHILGYRHPRPPPPHPLPSILLNAVTIFLCLLLTIYISHSLGYKIPYSLGATAILLFCAPASPLAQPRNTVLSQTLSAVVGVAFAHAVRGAAGDVEKWSAGAGAVAVVSVLMRVTGTVHPPAGATALLAVLEGERKWGFVGVVVVGSLVLCAGGVIVGGLEGQGWPVWWWREEGAVVVKKTGGDEDLERGEENVIVVGADTVDVPEEWKNDAELMMAVEEVRRCLSEKEKVQGKGSEESIES